MTPERRVRAVWDAYAKREGQPQLLDRVYILYCLLLFAGLYLAPLIYSTGSMPPLLTLERLPQHLPVVTSLLAAACWGPALLGRVWGPLLTRPFLVHVFTATDISPRLYLRPFARKRMFLSGAVVLAVLGALTHMMTDFYSTPSLVLPIVVGLAGVAQLIAAGWLWGQVKSEWSSVSFGAVTMLILVIALVCSVAFGTGGLGASAVPWELPATWAVPGTWGLARAWAVPGVWIFPTIAVVLGSGAMWRAQSTLDNVNLQRLGQDSERAATAQVFAQTGTFHHAVDLFRPDPRGLTGALLRADGRIRGTIAQGFVRALRTPLRAGVGTALLMGGVALISIALVAIALLGTAPLGTGLFLTWLVGALAVYFGLGQISSTWRSLLDELTQSPLYGPRGGGVVMRNLAWPLAVTLVGVAVGAALLVLIPGMSTNPARVSWPPNLFLSHLVLLILSMALAVTARFLREMKTELPVKLLYPIITPVGDASGLRVLAWQFDGILALVVGMFGLAWAPSLLAACLIGLALGGYCVRVGLRQAKEASPYAS